MARPLAIHLGAHKTATTYIQKCLARGRKKLAEQGVVYLGPHELRDLNGVIFPNPELIEAGALEEIQASTQKTLRATVKAAVPTDTKRLLLSEENFLGASRLNLRHRTLYPALEDRLNSLPPEWNRPGAEIYLSVRDYAPFYASCHSTVAARGDWYPLSVARQEDIAELPRRWPAVVADVRAHFDQATLTVWRHEDLGRLGGQVLEQMVGAPFDIDFSRQGTMSSLTGEGMRRVRAAFVRNGNERVSNEEVRAIRQETAQGYDRYDPWLGHLRKKMSKAYAHDWAKISSMQGVKVLT